ncbi:MAG TPA: MFS transporter [Steroidobacteraceae bacterium]|jgi:NNP family nitrate/nitrite transporter-like MFS transporter|nr:MFS transporter [Steroidobacteraceae bacterium]
MTQPIHGENPYRWVILAIMSFLFFVTNYAEFQLAGAAGSIFGTFHVTPFEFGMCLFAPFLMNFAFGIPIGMVADRSGTRTVGSVLLIIAAVGLVGRAYATTGFTSLFVWMLINGWSMVFVNTLGPKILRRWFKPGHMSIAMGVFIGFAGLGVGLGEGTASLFPSLHSAFVFAWIMFAVGTLWFLLGFKPKPADEPEAPPQPVLEFLGVASRNRYVWLSGIAVLCFFAAWVGTAGNLPSALTQIKQASPAAAGLLGIPLGFGGALGGFFVPTLLNKMGSVRTWLPIFVIVGSALIVASLAVQFGPLTWACVAVGAFIANGALPLTIPFPVMLTEIGATYGGSAGGIVSLLQMAGGFFIPTFVIALVAGTNQSKAFALLFALFVLSAIFAFLLPERGYHHHADAH